MKNLDRKTVEKNRRILMKDLCLRLVSLIPPSYFNTSHQHLMSQPDQVDHAASYITQLSQRIEKLKKKKEDLAATATATSTSRHHQGIDDHDHDQRPTKVVVEVRESGPIIEVTLISGVHKSFMLHEVLSIIEQEGAEVVTVNFSTVGGQTFHTIHARVKICRVGVETSRVRQRLQDIVNYF
ncbi:Transcription factor bHLH162 [Linum grandiflorum]